MANTIFFKQLANNEKKVSWRDILSESLKKHTAQDRDQLLAVGTFSRPINERSMLRTWRKPWLWTRVGLIGLLFIALLFASWYITDKQLVFLTMLFALMPLVVPLIEMVFFWELNIPQNISIWDMLLFFLFGGLLSILFSLLIFPSIPEGAIYAPLAEEPGKLLATLAIITYLIKKRKIKIYGITALAVGAAVGAGFSGFESIMYGVKSVVEGEVVGFFFHGSLTYGLTEGMRTIVLRALLAVGGHVQFVAPYAAASAIGGMKGPLSRFKKPGFWIAFFFSCCIHALWNGMDLLVNSEAEYWGSLAILIIAMWINILYWVRKCMKEAVQIGTTAAPSLNSIRWLTGPFAGNITSVLGDAVKIGRAVDNHVVFPANTAGVSRKHCILRSANGLTIEDVGSSNGTFVDGKKIPLNTLCSLSAGQKVALGSNKNTFLVM